MKVFSSTPSTNSPFRNNWYGMLMSMLLACNEIYVKSIDVQTECCFFFVYVSTLKCQAVAATPKFQHNGLDKVVKSERMSPIAYLQSYISLLILCCHVDVLCFQIDFALLLDFLDKSRNVHGTGAGLEEIRVRIHKLAIQYSTPDRLETKNRDFSLFLFCLGPPPYLDLLLHFHFFRRQFYIHFLVRLTVFRSRYHASVFKLQALYSYLQKKKHIP